MSKYLPQKSLEFRKFSEDELNWVKANYPFLQVRKEGEVLRGPLVFFAKYKDRNKEELELHDEYKVEIRIDIDNVPHVLETDGYLQRRAEELGKKDIMDMHVYPNTKKICMGTVPMIKAVYAADPTIKGIFCNLIIRYFYYHTYWEQQKVEPWDGLKHGDAGIIEEYVDNIDIVSINVSEYIRYLSTDLQKCLNNREFRRARKDCICKKRTIKKCNCRIEEKYSIFQKDLRAYKNKHTK